MTFTHAVVIAQIITFPTLGACFIAAGNWRLGVAQCCYGLATLALFYR
jgi:hypothetical protein